LHKNWYARCRGADCARAQEHAARVGIPAGDILPVRHIVQPSTATETTPAEAAAMAADPGYGTERPLAQRQAAAHLGQ
jgi:hypothetical protein